MWTIACNCRIFRSACSNAIASVQLPMHWGPRLVGCSFIRLVLARLCNTRYGFEPSPPTSLAARARLWQRSPLDEALLHCTAPSVISNLFYDCLLGISRCPVGWIYEAQSITALKHISRHDLHLPLAYLCIVLYFVRGWFSPGKGRRSFYSSTIFKWPDPRDSTTQPCNPNFDNASTSNPSPSSHRKSSPGNLWLY